MGIRWKDFELPMRVVLDEKTATDKYGQLTAEPFEKGFGTTIGNSLRRVLLSSIEGAAVIHVKIKGCPHEFMPVPGALEDVTDVILNVKTLRVKLHGDGVQKLRLHATQKGDVFARQFECPSSVEIVNPDLKILTLAEDREFDMEVDVRKGRGYVTVEEYEKEEQELGVIPVDALFSPVTRVAFRTENTRVGKRTDFDRLVLEIWTDGSISPEMALVEASKILRQHLNPFVRHFEIGKELARIERQEEVRKSKEERDKIREKLKQNIVELDLSVRAMNCLTAANIEVIGDLASKTRADLLKIKNFGKTTLAEVEEKLTPMELSLGMDVEAIMKD